MFLLKTEKNSLWHILILMVKYKQLENKKGGCEYVKYRINKFKNKRN